MDTREAAFRRAAMLLSTIGAEYAIVYQGKVHTSGDCKFAMQTKDGVMHINGIDVNAPKTLVGRKPFVKVNDFKHTGYTEVLPLLAEGDSWEYVCKSHKEAIAMQRAVCGCATRVWGKQTYISTVKDGNTLEILRLKLVPNEQTV